MNRCEVCGAPIDADNRFCRLCATKRLSLIPEPSIEVKESDSGPEEENTGEFILGQGRRRAGRNLKHTPRLSFAVLEGKYRLLEEVGRGAMGTVFRAEDISLKREVAVKFLLPELARSPDSAEQFRREAAGMAAIGHLNVAQVFAYGRYGKIPYFTMEYLEGESAEELVDEHNKRGIFVPLDKAIDILVQALDGLAAIHRSGVVHRDIKPANIMLVGDPLRAVITDFGLLRYVRVRDKLQELTGTPAYIAPELIEGVSGADSSLSADLYSMGVTAYELITGSLPFQAESWVDILRMHVAEMPRFPSDRRTGLPPEMDEIILRAMNKDPASRYRTAEEFLADLLAIEQKEMSLERRRHSLVPPPMRDRFLGQGNGRADLENDRAQRGKPLLPSGRLLVADPDSKFRDEIYRRAKALVPGCRVQSVSDGMRALALVHEFKPNVVILDLALPEINGLELVATLRGDPEFAGLTIIVVSASGGQPEARILSALDVHHFYTKPVDLKNLGDVIGPLLGSSAGAQFR